MEATLLSSYSSYKASARDAADIVVMIANDYMFLQQQQPAQAPQHQQQQQPQHHQQQQQQQNAGSNIYGQHAAGNARAYGGQQPMDISNHSVIGLGPAPADRGQSVIPDVSNHSHGPLGHPPSGIGN